MKIPSTIQEAIQILEEEILPKEDLLVIDEMNDPSDMIALHHGLGTYLRNNWKLWHIGESPMREYFKAKDITHANDMSHHILTALWHKRHDGPGEEDGPWAKGWEERSTPEGGTITKYELIRGETVASFNESVTKALQNGATLYGPPLFDGFSYCQAVTFSKVEHMGPM